ncbi:glutamate-cysteine ligase family protein [Spirochaeta lutea]|uniref:glutamate-cysteine ligase family protein n=1 Tax=Spirochaeta lutea TaxID=1480694 RepID=UPI0006902499|nr:glutamate-cysteine ligase family protein [Spirochaeta lutea]
MASSPSDQARTPEASPSGNRPQQTPDSSLQDPHPVRSGGASQPPALLEAGGIELEYAIVRADTLAVVPRAETLLGSGASEVEHPPLSWSNELVMHVIELKNPLPVTDLTELEPSFRAQVGQVNNTLLQLPQACCLLPTGAHPWMDPAKETRMWPHEQTEIYQAYDRIFSTRGHGWANLQSCHLNLSFRSDEDFFRLHTAIRLLLPLLPGLWASTPYLGGTYAAAMDARLETYAGNQHRIPEIAGDIIPEQVSTIEEYHQLVLQPMYRAIAPQDPEGLLQEEWLNSRGAIPKFSRNSMEIRILDLQGHPTRDLLFSLVTIALIRRLAFADSKELRDLSKTPQEILVSQYRRCVSQASAAPLSLPYIPRIFADLLPRGGQAPRVRDFWTAALHWFASDHALPPALEADLQDCLTEYPHRGSLAETLYQELGPAPSRSQLFQSYRRLAAGLPGAESLPPAPGKHPAEQ